jgi:hypothetical protein
MTLADRIAEIQARADAATKGPWLTVKNNHISLGTPGFDYDSHRIVWSAPEGDVAYVPPTREELGNLDAAFIAAARADVPALCAALTVACEALERALERVENWDCDCDVEIEVCGKHPMLVVLRTALAEIERIIGGGK